MTFAPGDEVVCVDDRAFPVQPNPIYHAAPWDSAVRMGQHYVVRWAGMIDHIGYQQPYFALRLDGVFRDAVKRNGRVVIEDCPLWAGRFRPVRRETIEQFRKMCISNKPLVEV